MAVHTQFPTANEIETTGWTNPNNAHADDNTVATAAPAAKSTSISTRWKTFGFDAVIPAGDIITKVQIIYGYSTSTTLSIATMRARAQIGGVDQANHDDASEPASETAITVNITADRAWTRNDLLDANFKATLEAMRGNSSTAVTFNLDYVKVEVTHNPPGLIGDYYNPFRANHAKWSFRPTNENPAVASVGPAQPTGAPRSVVRGFGSQPPVPRSFTNLSIGWGASWIGQQVQATSIVGDAYRPIASHSTWKARQPNDNPIFAASATLWGDNYQPCAKHDSWRAKPITDYPAFANANILRGDNYSPYAQFKAWRTKPVNDNPTTGQQATTTAVFGDSYQPVARWQHSRVIFGTAAPEPEPPPNPILIGDTYNPRAAHSQWWARRAISDGNAFPPSIPIPTFIGDTYNPRADHSQWWSALAVSDGNAFPPASPLWGDFHNPFTGLPQRYFFTWRTEPRNDNPVFDTKAVLWGDFYNAFRAAAPLRRFKGSRISAGGTGAGREFVDSGTGGEFRKIITVHHLTRTTNIRG